MTDVSETLKTLYTAPVEHDAGAYQISIPERELAAGTLTEGETYRIALLSTTASDDDSTQTTESADANTHDEQQEVYDGPPVTEGEHRDVEIKNLGDQGDGIAKVERGYVVIVPDTSVGDRVTVEIQQARENVAFADVVGRSPRSEF